MLQLFKVSRRYQRAHAGARKVGMVLLSVGCSYYSEGLLPSSGAGGAMSGAGGETPREEPAGGAPGAPHAGGSGSSVGGAAGPGSSSGSTAAVGGAAVGGAAGEAGSGEAASDECP